MFAFVQISERGGGSGALFFLIMVETSAFAIAPPAVDAGTTAANVLLGIKLLCLAKRTSAATVSVSAVCTTCIMACIVLQQFWWADWSTYWNTVIHPAWSEWSCVINPFSSPPKKNVPDAADDVYPAAASARLGRSSSLIYCFIALEC